MDLSASKRKKGLITKTWERCKSFGGKNQENKRAFLKKGKYWPRLDAKIGKTLDNIVPTGCFHVSVYVYVGPQRQRFVMKTKHANHPLFITLLEEAEFEYGYKSEVPLELPCDVDDFLQVLLEIDRCSIIKDAPLASKFYQNVSYHHLTQTQCKIVAISTL